MSSLFRSPLFDPEARSASPRPVTVAHVVRGLVTGGQEVLVARLAERLDRHRFRPVVISLQEGGWLVHHLESVGIPVYCLNGAERLDPLLVWRIARVLRRERVEVVHCHNRTPLFYAGIAARLAPASRLVFTLHGNFSLDDSGTAPFIRALLRRAGSVIPVSGEIERTLRDGGWAQPDQMEVICNGVDTDLFQPESGAPWRSRLGFRPEHRVIGTVARLAPEKDQASLLRAFACLRRNMPEARLLIVGDGPLRSELERLAEQLGIADATRFTGEQRETRPYYQAMDVFALPSLTEGTSLTLLEAMACARPVVASAVGGTPDVVRDGVSGILVPAARPDALAQALREVAGLSDAQRRQLGAAGREIVLRQFSLNSMVRRHEAIYERLAAPDRRLQPWSTAALGRTMRGPGAPARDTTVES